MLSKIQSYLVISAIIAILGITIYSAFFGPSAELNSAIKELKIAREEIAKTQQNLDSILSNTQTVLDRNAGFKNYIHAVDSIVKASDAISRSRESKYLQSLNKLEKSITHLKSDLAKFNDKLPEPENGEMETK
jgi:flagellar capping protein FliD